MSEESGASPPLDVRVDVEGSSIIVWLRGELDMDSVPDLIKAFVRVFAEPAPEIVVDLSDLAFLDSSGIRALLDSCTTAKERGTAYRVRRPQHLVRRVLVVSGVTDYLGLFRRTK